MCPLEAAAIGDIEGMYASDKCDSNHMTIKLPIIIDGKYEMLFNLMRKMLSYSVIRFTFGHKTLGKATTRLLGVGGLSFPQCCC